MCDSSFLVLTINLSLLQSRNSAVVMAVAALHYHCGPRHGPTLHRIGKALVRCMRSHREIAFVILKNIATYAEDVPEMFAPFFSDFFVAVCFLSFLLRVFFSTLSLPAGIRCSFRSSHEGPYPCLSCQLFQCELCHERVHSIRPRRR